MPQTAILSIILSAEHSGKEMKRLREEARLSKSDLAKRMGISVSTLNDYEERRSPRSQKILENFVNALES